MGSYRNTNKDSAEAEEALARVEGGEDGGVISKDATSREETTGNDHHCVVRVLLCRREGEEEKYWNTNFFILSLHTNISFLSNI